MDMYSVIAAKLASVRGAGPDDQRQRRVNRLGLAHDIFHGLENVGIEAEEAKRHAGAARSCAADGDTIGADFDALRAKLARTAAARQLLGAVVDLFALVRLSGIGPGDVPPLLATLEEQERAWLSAVLGAGF